MRKHLPDVNYFIQKNIPELSDYKILELIGSGCNAHVFKAFSEKVNNHISCKIIPKANLAGVNDDPPLWRAEIDKANLLDNKTVVKFFQVSNWIDAANHIDCIVLCSEYVNGPALEQYLKDHPNDISVSFSEHFLKVLLAFIHDMERYNVTHGDLHLKNILVEDRTDQLNEPDFAFRVTDFGVATATADRNFKDDYLQLADDLKTILENINYQLLTPRDKFAFNILNDHFLARHLIESDLTRDPLARQTKSLYERLDTIDEEYNKLQKETSSVKLLTPFDYLSCEQIGESHSLLKALYSNLFLGLQEIEGRNNLVLTGPRGCGKSTVFKSLSLRHRTLTNEADPNDIEYIGIYYRCDDLYSAFPRYELPNRKEGYDIPVHYLVATLVCSMLEVVELWGMTHFSETFLKNEKKVSMALWKLFDIESPKEPGVQTFKAIIARLQKERMRSVRKQRFIHTDEQIGSYFGPHILIRVAESLSLNFNFLRTKPFYFFIDDYSMPKITSPLQQNINRLFMQRTDSCFFKLSTESPVSYVGKDIDGKAYVEGREFVLLNLGLVYLSAKPAEISAFIEDVFTKRFQAIPEYPVADISTLVGNYDSPSFNEIALSIRRSEKPEMWGKETLAQLCSGDIFYIISLVGRMVTNIGGRERLAEITDIPKISKEIQKKSIREEAGNFLINLRGVQGGEHLVQVVTAFGNVAHSYLKFRNSKNEEGNPPHLASRIEPYEALNLSTRATDVYSQLLQYSLFLEDPRGKSRRGKVVPRLYLRRSLLPIFNLTFGKRDSIELEVVEIENLLLSPKEFEQRYRLKNSERSESSQQLIFDDFSKKDN